MTYDAFPYRAPGSPYLESFDVAGGMSAGSLRASAVVHLTAAAAGTINDGESWPNQHYLLVGLRLALLPVGGGLLGGNLSVELNAEGAGQLGHANGWTQMAPVLHWPAGGVQEMHDLLPEGSHLLTIDTQGANPRIRVNYAPAGATPDVLDLFAYFVAVAPEPSC